MRYRAAFKTKALSDTCTIETGTVTSPTSTTVSCLSVPPKTSQDDSMLTLLVEDTTQAYGIGIRVVFHSARYLVKKVEYDRKPGFTRLHCQSWQETLS